MKKIILILVCFSTLSFMGCDDSCVCQSGPHFGELTIKLTINDENPEVWVTVFRDKIEQKDTLFHESTSSNRIYYELEAGRYYSATVTYQKGVRQITAVDGKRMEVMSDDCGCDYAEDINLNLKLLK